MFERASDAVIAAVALQRAIVSTRWPKNKPVAVRVGVHTGEPLVRNDNYFGDLVTETARLRSLGHGGQILTSSISTSLGGTSTTDVFTGQTMSRSGGPQAVATAEAVVPAAPTTTTPAGTTTAEPTTTTPAASTTTPITSITLPVTGGGTGSLELTGIALAMVVLGALALLATTARRRHP